MGTRRRRNPPGWSRPLKAAEVAELFPSFGHTYFSESPYRWKDRDEISVVSVQWWISDPPFGWGNPVLSIGLVPSEERSAVHDWIVSVVAGEVENWRAAASASATWAEANEIKSWTWTRQSSRTNGTP